MDLPFPATTLRLLSRWLGLTETSRLEPALMGALERADTGWFVSRRNDEVRISCRMPGPLLSVILTGLSTHGCLTERLARAHLDVASRPGAERVYVTFQPDSVNACSVGYRADARVEAFARHVLGVGASTSYLKGRIDPATLSPSWTTYGPWARD